jgi:DNA replication ATP-dependent helicase Dna2
LPFNNRYQIKYSSNLLVLPNNQVIDRKLNVAMSRAREFLGIFGNFHLISSSKIYSKLADYLRDHNLIVSLTNYS